MPKFTFTKRERSVRVTTFTVEAADRDAACDLVRAFANAPLDQMAKEDSRIAVLDAFTDRGAQLTVADNETGATVTNVNVRGDTLNFLRTLTVSEGGYVTAAEDGRPAMQRNGRTLHLAAVTLEAGNRLVFVFAGDDGKALLYPEDLVDTESLLRFEVHLRKKYNKKKILLRKLPWQTKNK